MKLSNMKFRKCYLYCVKGGLLWITKYVLMQAVSIALVT
ncbi:protein of unknown function [Tepidibacter aestuarii]|nr:protein of unknown function [Tepidibacter aestuarii]